MKATFLFLASVFAVSGCGATISTVDGGFDAMADDGGSDGAATDGADDVVDGGAWHLVDGGGSCAPEAGLTSLSSCCNNQACNGVCVGNDIGDVQCWCAGVVGGCTGGLTCCKVPNACVSPDKCGLGQ
jgi:hypothetical protein